MCGTRNLLRSGYAKRMLVAVTGAGNGVVLSAALSNGASKAHGFELPENKANRYIFKAAMAQMTKIFGSRAPADLEFKNVEKVETELFSFG